MAKVDTTQKDDSGPESAISPEIEPSLVDDIGNVEEDDEDEADRGRIVSFSIPVLWSERW